MGEAVTHLGLTCEACASALVCVVDREEELSDKVIEIEEGR